LAFWASQKNAPGIVNPALVANVCLYNPVGFQMLGVDMDKLFKEQEKKLRRRA
jgi:hypothetical protein